MKCFSISTSHSFALHFYPLHPFPFYSCSASREWRAWQRDAWHSWHAWRRMKSPVKRRDTGGTEKFYHISRHSLYFRWWNKIVLDLELHYLSNITLLGFKQEDRLRDWSFDWRVLSWWIVSHEVRVEQIILIISLYKTCPESSRSHFTCHKVMTTSVSCSLMTSW